MVIRDIQAGRISLPLRHPFKTALRTVDAVEDVVVRVVADTGEVGYGEAPPTAVITGDTLGSIECAVRDFIRPALLGMDVEDLDAVMAKLQGCMVKNTSAKAAVDMAVYDLWGKRLGAPLYQLLGGARRSFETDLTISVNPIDQMVADSLEAVAPGLPHPEDQGGQGGQGRTWSASPPSAAPWAPTCSSGWTPTRAGTPSSRCPSSGPWRTRGWTSSWWSSR